MSFILDALRKSEIERQRDSAPGLIRSPLAAVRREIPAWSWLLIGLLTLALAGLTAAWWLRDRSEPGGTLTVMEPAATTAVVAGALDPSRPAPEFSQSASGDARSALTPPATGTAEPRPIEDLIRMDPNLPALTLTALQYNAADPARPVWINGRRYVPGQRIEGGPELVAIRADGVVLSYRGETFLLTP
jgi:hypothetical protein